MNAGLFHTARSFDHGIHPDDFSISEDKYLVDVEIRKFYVDPRK